MDGASFTSTYLGEARGRTRVPCIFGEQSIQEFQVSNNPYSAAYGGGGSGFVNTVTKSGTDHFHGDTFYYNPDGATLNQTCYLISSTGTEGFPDAAVHQPAQRAASVPVCVYLELLRGARSTNVYGQPAGWPWPEHGSTLLTVPERNRGNAPALQIEGDF